MGEKGTILSKSCVCFWWFYAVASCRALLQIAEVNPGLSLIIGSSDNNCLSLPEKRYYSLTLVRVNSGRSEQQFLWLRHPEN